MGSEVVNSLAKSPCLNCRTGLKLPEIMPLCTPAALHMQLTLPTGAVLTANSQFYPCWQASLLYTGEQHRETILFLGSYLNWQVLMHIIPPTCTEQRVNGNYVSLDQMLSSYSFTLFLLVINKRNLSFKNDKFSFTLLILSEVIF